MFTHTKNAALHVSVPARRGWWACDPIVGRLRQEDCTQPTLLSPFSKIRNQDNDPKIWGLLTHMRSFPSSPADKAVAGPFMESQRTGVIGDPDVNGEHWDPEPRISRSVHLLRNFWKFLTAVLNTNISCLCFFGNATLIRVMWSQFTQGVIMSFL